MQIQFIQRVFKRTLSKKSDPHYCIPDDLTSRLVYGQGTALRYNNIHLLLNIQAYEIKRVKENLWVVLTNTHFIVVALENSKLCIKKEEKNVKDIYLASTGIYFSVTALNEKSLYFLTYDYDIIHLASFGIKTFVPRLKYISGFIIADYLIKLEFYATVENLCTNSNFIFSEYKIKKISPDKIIQVQFNDGQVEMTMRKINSFQSPYINDQLETSDLIVLDMDSKNFKKNNLETLGYLNSGLLNEIHKNEIIESLLI